jgi:hypothetical protein
MKEIPSDQELVQMHLSIMLPPSIKVSRECEIVAPPPTMPPLPHVSSVENIEQQTIESYINYFTRGCN